MNRTIAIAALAFLCLALAAWAAPDGDLSAEQQDAFAGELAEARERLEQARERRDAAQAAYSEARHDQYPRGEALAEIEREFADAKRDLAASEDALRALVEHARQAGVSPEILRPYR